MLGGLDVVGQDPQHRRLGDPRHATVGVELLPELLGVLHHQLDAAVAAPVAGLDLLERLQPAAAAMDFGTLGVVLDLGRGDLLAQCRALIGELGATPLQRIDPLLGRRGHARRVVERRGEVTRLGLEILALGRQCGLTLAPLRQRLVLSRDAGLGSGHRAAALAQLGARLVEPASLVAELGVDPRVAGLEPVHRARSGVVVVPGVGGLLGPHLGELLVGVGEGPRRDLGLGLGLGGPGLQILALAPTVVVLGLEQAHAVVEVVDGLLMPGELLLHLAQPGPPRFDLRLAGLQRGAEIVDLLAEIVSAAAQHLARALQLEELM